MRLMTLSDYAFRVLMYAGAAHGRLITIDETSKVYGISKNHLMKVVNILTRSGYLKGVRGRSGGFTLARQPEDICLGAIVRITEPDFALVECFASGNKCIITCNCRLPNVLNEALTSFVSTLDRYTLKDLMLEEVDFGVPAVPSQETRGPDFIDVEHRD